MRANLLGLDHVVVLVNDLDAARDTYSRIGFTLTPRGFHSIGTQNHCLMFGNDYLELLAVEKPHPVTQYFSDFLATSEGAAAIALATDDAEAAWSSLRASGMQADAPVDFSRPVALPDGTREARFRVVQLPVDATPGARTFLCQHFTPDIVWRPEYQDHRVGVTGVAGVTVVAGDMRAAAQAYGRVVDVKAEEFVGGWRLQVGTTQICIVERSGLHSLWPRAKLPTRDIPVLGALWLRVRDRGLAVATLRRGGFNPQREATGSWAIGADEAHGVALIFD